MKKVLCLLWFGCVFFSCAARAGGTEDFCKLYAEMPKSYVRPVNVKEIAEAVLKNFSIMDKQLHLGGKGDKLTLYYKGKSWSFAKPKGEDDANAWCRLTKEVAQKAGEYSEKFLENDYLLSEKVLTETLPLFDKDSKFFGDGLEMTNKRLKHKRLFAARMEESKRLYLKISIFNSHSLENLKKAFADFPEAEALTIDLRGNPGGSLEAAVAAADLFLDGGIIVSTHDEKGGSEVFYNADEAEEMAGKKILILVDGQTASAAEMFAQALADQGRAEVEGSETYGKKTLQNLIELPGGGVAAVTEAYFRPPSEI